jgi:glycine betaine/choline ABC-type transport system substrate-binding protein/ABC-type proline/glycine betaine transport system permease subunit
VAQDGALMLASFLPFGDAVDFIFHRRPSVGGGADIGGSTLWPLLWTHLEVVGASLGIAIAIGVLPALWLGHRGSGQVLASVFANTGRAIPSYALVVFTSTYIGLNFRNLMFAMVVLAVPPIFTNTYVGIRQVDRDVVDAARGMGMTGGQIVKGVEVPLALPLIFGGIRTSAINVVATATLGPVVGVLTLGDPIINDNVYGPSGRLGGAILVALLALASEALFSGLQRLVTPAGLKRQTDIRSRSLMKSRTILAALLALAATLVLAACGDNNDKSSDTGAATPATTQSDSGKTIQPVDGAGSTPPIKVGSKNFTEEFILGNIFAQALEAAGYKVNTQLNLGSEQIAYKALKAGKIDGYPEYTGTALTSFYKVDIKKVPKDAQAAYDLTKSDAEKDGVVALPQTPFTDSNGFAMTQKKADELGIKSISDLKGKESKLTLAGPPECRQRPDCALGLKTVYGLNFGKFITVDLAKRHEVLTNGQADVSLVFTTDGQIKADKLALLDDDKAMFPPYNASFLVRKQTIDSHPGMDKVIEQVEAGLTTEVMQELNSRVDLDKQKPEDVAKAYLTESGLISG